MTNNRRCGDCQLCCRLLPTPEIDKPHDTKCRHQCRTGCAIYASRPNSCRLWSCRWLLGDDTGPRPDRAHLVIDCIPDYVTQMHDGEPHHSEVIQVWIDPRHPDAHRAPAFRAFVEREGKPALVRYDEREAVIVVPPQCVEDGQWFVHRLTLTRDQPHSATDVAQKLGGLVIEVDGKRVMLLP